MFRHILLAANEQAMTLPGDELIAHPSMVVTHLGKSYSVRAHRLQYKFSIGIIGYRLR